MKTSDVKLNGGSKDLQPDVIKSDNTIMIVSAVEGIGIKDIVYNREKEYIRIEFFDSKGRTISRFCNSWRNTDRYRNSNKKEGLEIVEVTPYIDIFRTYFGDEGDVEITDIHDIWNNLFKKVADESVKSSFLPTKIAEDKKLKLVFQKDSGIDPEYRVAYNGWFGSNVKFSQNDKRQFTITASGSTGTSGGFGNIGGGMSVGTGFGSPIGSVTSGTPVTFASSPSAIITN